MSRSTGDSDSVAELRAERDEAISYARRVEHELGAARGRIKRLELVLYRRTQRRRLWAGRLERAGRLLRRRPS